jgi:hypothetical protein
MTQKQAILSLLLALLSYFNSSAQNSADDMAAKFFDIYKTYGSDKAIDYIYSTNKYSSENLEGVDEVKGSLRKALTLYGNYWGYDLITKKMAGENFVMMTFLVKYDRVPITFRLLFYKPHDKWQVQNFKFDNKMDDELEEASKAIKFKSNLE